MGHPSIETCYSPEKPETAVQHAFEGRSYEDISGRFGIPKATVGTRRIGARRKLLTTRE